MNKKCFRQIRVPPTMILVLAVALGSVPWGRLVAQETLRVGAKSFTESEVLAQMAAHLARDLGLRAEVIELHGTRLAWSALLAGDIDLYPEYTGTIRQEILSEEQLADDSAIGGSLSKFGIEMTAPLGFNNTYVLGMRSDHANALKIRSISDLKQHPNLRYGFSNEFLDRADGWPSLRRRYQLESNQVTGLEHGLAYRAVSVGDIDVTDLYSTDPNISQYDLVLLDDDLQHFPRYNALFLYRRPLAEGHPNFVQQLKRLEGRLDERRMRGLNEAVQIDGQTAPRVAAGFVSSALGVEVEVDEPTLVERLARRTIEHLALVAFAMGASLVISIPLGIAAAKNRWAGQLILGVVEVVQTIPGLALLVFIGTLFLTAGLPMIGAAPVIAALFLYSLLPIVRNTSAGLKGVPPALQESAVALGLPPLARLLRIELPLASPSIFAGIKTAAVISVGYAALGGLIGAGGYGQPIMTGLRLNDQRLMMEGAVPAALLALVVKLAFEACERWLVPRGLR